MKVCFSLKHIYNSSYNNYSQPKNTNTNYCSGIYLENNTTPAAISFCAKPILNKDYDKWFKTYLRYVDEKDFIANEIFENIKISTSHLKNKNKIKILDIGCGNGELTQKYLKHLSGLFSDKKIEVEAVDLNTELLNDFRLNHMNFDKNVSVNLINKNFFSEYPSTEERYDIVIASHVMYYTPNLSESFTKIKNYLSAGGKALIFHHSGDGCILSGMRERYNPQSSANIKPAKNKNSNVDHIGTILDNLGIMYEVKKQFFNMFFPENLVGADGRNLISFIIDKPFVDLLKENKVNKIIKELRSNFNGENKLKLHNNMYVIENNICNNISDNLKRFKGNINAVFADIDGTISAKSDYVSPRTIDAVKKLHDNNIPLILTTARTYKDTLPIIEQLNITPQYTIVLQGGSIIDSSRNPIIDNVIDKETGLKLVDWYEKIFAKDKDSHLIMYFDDDPYSMTNIQYPWKARKLITKVNSFCELFKQANLQKALIYNPNPKTEDMAMVTKMFEDAGIANLQLHTTGSGIYEFQNSKVSKEKAIDYVLSKLNIPPQKAMAIGDSSNDISMLDFIRNNKGLAAVMGNSNDFVKLHGNVTTENVESDGFALVIENII